MKKKTTKRAGKKPTDRPRPQTTTPEAPEPAVPVIVEAPRCELCGEPAGDGSALCPACAASRCAPGSSEEMVGECLRVLEEPNVLFVQRGSAETLTPVPPTRGAGKSARTLIRWLKDQRRRGGALTEQQEADIVEMARAAWREAVAELRGQQPEQEQDEASA